MGYYSDNMVKGNIGEKTAANMFRRLGYKIVPSSTEDNKLHDIDGYLEICPGFGGDILGIDGFPISIKHEEDGFKYGEVYFEVSSQVKPQYRDRFPDCTVDGWVDSVLHNTKAKLFCIIQPKLVGKVKKPSLLVLPVDAVRGIYSVECYSYRAKVLALSSERKAALCTEHTYPFQDATCYYMKRKMAEEIAIINIT